MLVKTICVFFLSLYISSVVLLSTTLAQERSVLANDVPAEKLFYDIEPREVGIVRPREKIVLDVPVQNTSSTELELVGHRVSCLCTSIKLLGKAEILPGESRTVRVEIEAKEHDGDQAVSATLKFVTVHGESRVFEGMLAFKLDVRADCSWTQSPIYAKFGASINKIECLAINFGPTEWGDIRAECTIDEIRVDTTTKKHFINKAEREVVYVTITNVASESFETKGSLRLFASQGKGSLSRMVGEVAIDAYAPEEIEIAPKRLYLDDGKVRFFVVARDEGSALKVNRVSLAGFEEEIAFEAKAISPRWLEIKIELAGAQHLAEKTTDMVVEVSFGETKHLLRKELLQSR